MIYKTDPDEKSGFCYAKKRPPENRRSESYSDQMRESPPNEPRPMKRLVKYQKNYLMISNISLSMRTRLLICSLLSFDATPITVIVRSS